MSFGIKTTRKLLEPENPTDKKPEVSLFDENGDLKPYSQSYKASESESNKPSSGSAKGLAIRVIKSATADHM